jgi:hypothetical protein
LKEALIKETGTDALSQVVASTANQEKTDSSDSSHSNDGIEPSITELANSGKSE